MPKPTLTTLRSSPLLEGLPQKQLEELTQASVWHSYQAGNTIIRQNEESTDVCFVIAGFVKIIRGGKNTDLKSGVVGTDRRNLVRREIMVALIGPGDIVGEVTALLNRGRSASVIALTPCEVILMPRDSFLKCFVANPTFSLVIARRLANRLAEADRQLELMRGNVEGRIHALLRHCRELGIDGERWLSNAEIARMVGATRVAVSKIVNEMSRRQKAPQPLEAPPAGNTSVKR